MPTSSKLGDSPFTVHPRGFAANRYVYPVLSRRAGGISIGVNLNPDKGCDFDCVYCQVDRGQPGVPGGVDLAVLGEELDRMIERVASNEIFGEPRFRETPPPLRRFNDIAFSGDGEPTAAPLFDRAVELCAEARRRHRLDEVKLVLITNATLLDRPRVRAALETLMANGGEIWAKLDAGTEAYYRQVNRSTVAWRRILDNLRETATAWPLVIQSLFLRIHGEPPPPAEIDAYCKRLEEILDASGRIKLVQVHTIARRTAEPWVAALADDEVDAIADLVRCRTGLQAAAFHGRS